MTKIISYKYLLQLILLILLFNYNTSLYAVIESRPMGSDERRRLIVYNPYGIFRYVGYYNYHTSIEFADDEIVETILMGDSKGWQVIPLSQTNPNLKNKLSIKPIDLNATTNMTVITNKRTYYFELYAEHADKEKGVQDPNITFSLKFLYPDSNNQNFNIANHTPDLYNPETVNFLYSISGSEEIAPVTIYDDGEFTYLQFRHYNAEMPAIFSVNLDRKESIVNYSMSSETKNLIILEGVYRRLALRNGNKVTCIFNEMFD